MPGGTVRYLACFNHSHAQVSLSQQKIRRGHAGNAPSDDGVIRAEIPRQVSDRALAI